MTDIAAAFDMVQKMEHLVSEKGICFRRSGKMACAFYHLWPAGENGWNSARYFETVKG